ncbi:MAG: hypothetical protein LQ339_004050 [Xanthoria mediterranea]|nr:MAG: hypothetical protein LQ339_004050 [Xanthoria mediterranea]
MLQSDPQLVLNQARALDQVLYADRRPLHGVAVAIKEAINTKGNFSITSLPLNTTLLISACLDMPTCFGSPLYQDHHPSSDAFTVSILECAGVKVEQLAFPPDFDDFGALKRMHSIVAHSEGQATFLKEYRLDKSKLHPEIRSIVQNQSNYTREEIVRALDGYARMRPIFDQIAANYSAIITPSAVDEATLGLEDMGSSAFNWFWTVSASLLLVFSLLAELDQGIHMPVINIPAFTGAHGTPIGISVVAGRHFDQHLLKISRGLSEPLMAQGGWGTEKLESTGNPILVPNGSCNSCL